MIEVDTVCELQTLTFIMFICPTCFWWFGIY